MPGSNSIPPTRKALRTPYHFEHRGVAQVSPIQCHSEVLRGILPGPSEHLVVTVQTVPLRDQCDVGTLAKRTVQYSECGPG